MKNHLPPTNFPAGLSNFLNVLGSGLRQRFNLLLLQAFALTGMLSWSQQSLGQTTIIGFDVSQQTNYGTSPLTPTTVATNVTATGLTRGSGVGQSGTAAARGWGGTGWTGTTAANAITANTFATFTVKANTGYVLSLSAVNPFSYRRSPTGPPSGLLQYQVGAGAFQDVTTLPFSSTSSSGATLSAVDLTGITALQNIPATSTITFRIVPYGASSTGPWYLYDVGSSTASDLGVSGTVVSAPTSPTCGTINVPADYPTIQAAVTAACSGAIIQVASGTYNEQVSITKSLTIIGVGATKPILNFTGTPALANGHPTIFDITTADVRIENLDFDVDLTKLNSAVLASAADIRNLAVVSNTINPYRSGAITSSFGNRNAISINYGGPTNYRFNSSNSSGLLIQGNTVSYFNNGTPADPSDDAGFRAGVATDEGGGSFTGNTIQATSADILVRFALNGAVSITNNNFNGFGLELAEFNAGATSLLVTGNTFNGTFGSPFTSSLRLKNNTNSIPTTVANNTFTGHNLGISLENYQAVTVDNNTFTPAANSTTYRHIVENTKEGSSSSGFFTPMVSLTLTRNTFNGSGATGGTGLAFYNQDNDSPVFGTFTLGTPGNENNFTSGLGTFIYLDNTTGTAAPNATQVVPWSTNLNAVNNKFDAGNGLKLASNLTAAERATLETKLFHKPDDAQLGLITYFYPVMNVTQNQSYSSIQTAIDAANANDVIQLAEYTFNERASVTKPLTLSGVSQTGTIIDGTGLAAGNGFTLQDNVSGITISNLTIRKQIGSANATGSGIYGKTNNNLTITNVSSVSNAVHGIILETSGTLTNVSVTSSTLSSNGIGNGGRGFIIFNNLKQNITLTNNLLQNNGLTGIDINEGTATGITITGNTTTGNGDEGIGLIGAIETGGANRIADNTITDNGRYGLEVKSSIGTGATSGAGSLVIENNTISRTTDLPGSRDIAGISVTRRGAGVSVNTRETPQGAVVKNNTVTGFVNSGTGDGFGIVVEGINYQVTGNTVSGNNVGIQEQQTPAGQRGRTNGSPSDGDSPYDMSDYFDRGNSIYSCGVVATNTLSGNTIDMRAVGATAAGRGLVTNTSTGASYCTIQSAVDAANAGDLISASAGNYPEAVTVSKSLTLIGANTGVSGFGTRSAESIIDGGGTRTGLLVSAPNVVVDGFKFVAGQGTYGAAVAFNGQQAGVQIINNLFTDNVVGVVEPTANAAIKNNLFDGNNRAGAAGGSGIYTDVATNGLTVENNEFKNHTTNSAVIFGATASNTHQNLVFSKNYIHDNNGDNSMVYCVAISGGTFSQNTINEPAATAIKFAGANTSVTVLNNFLDNNGVGVRVADDGYGLGSNTGIEVHNNSLTGNSIKAIDNPEAAATINATCNWYGTTNVDAQAATLFGGPVTYSPYLSSGTDNEAGTPGFQPVPGSCTSMLSLTFTASPTMLLTTGTTTLSATVSGGNTPLTYTFSGTGTISQSPGSNMASVTNIPAGVQTFTVVVSDATSPTSQTISGTVSVTVTQANTPPMATANNNQTATVGMPFSYTVNAFTDSETPNNLTYTASIVPANGLMFDPNTRIISGTPSMTGVSSVTVTATDPGSLSASTTFTITVSPAPIVPLSLTFTASPNMILTSGTTTLSATVSGGTTPYSYTFTGTSGTITPTGNTATVSNLMAGVQTFTVVARDATTPTSQTISGTVSVTVTQANTPPTVANAVSPQSATVGVAYTLSLANVFTDAETPNSLTLSVSTLPAGLSFTAPATISGTPSMSGVTSVTATATDPGGLTATNSFTITVQPAPVVVTPLALTFTASPNMILTSGTTTLSATVSGGTTPYSYTFTGSSGTITPTGNTATVSNLMAGVQTFTVVARDATTPTSQTISGTVSVTVNQATPPPTAPFSITGVTTLSCQTISAGQRRVTFNPRYAGLNGTPVSFSVVNELVTTTAPGPYTLNLYTDNSVITLSATQSGANTQFAYNWLTACGSSTANTPPTVANAVGPQSATVGIGYTLSLANVFTDAETPNGLTLSVTGLPAGLSFVAPSTISGTPSMSGVTSVTVTATDPGGLMASNTFSITVSPAAGTPPPPTGTFSITGVTTISCEVISAGQRRLTFNPRYAGQNGAPISFSVVNELAATTNPGPYTLNLYTDNSVVTLQAVQSGISSSFAYNWLAVCSSTTANTAPTVANAVGPQSATVGIGYTLSLANVFTDAETPNQLTLSVSSLPAGLSFTAPATISGTPSMSGVTSVTATATDPGGLTASNTFTITVNPASDTTPPPNAPFSITGVTTVNCQVLSAGQRRVSFTPRYAGVDGSPVSFSVVNELLPTTAPGPYSLDLYTDNPMITLSALQSGVSSTFGYNWLAACTPSAPGARVSSEPVSGLQLQVLGNPVREVLDVVVTGAAGSSLQLTLTDGQGRVVGQHALEQATASERVRLSLSTQGAGVLILRATTPTQSKTVKVIKSE